jgi:hypothetical protein
LIKIGGPLLSTPEKGAMTSVYLATSPEVENINGVYFAHLKKAKITKMAQNREYAQRLWDISMGLGKVKEYGLIESL